jgi:hypothetical protein
MRTESVAKSTQMLKGILDGKTYVAVAQESGLSRSAVEQRVKALARDRTRSIPARSAKILLLAQETAAVSQSSWTGLIHLLRSTGRQKPESPRRIMRTPGHAWRSRVTSSFKIAAACSAPSYFAGRRWATSSCSPQKTYNGRKH